MTAFEAKVKIDTVTLLSIAYQNACHSTHPLSAYAMRIIHSAYTQAKRVS